MTIVESITLILALVYVGTLLYWNGHKYGAYTTIVFTLIAVGISMHPQLIFALAVSQIAFLGIKYTYPQLLANELRINPLRQAFQNFLALSLLFTAIQYTLYLVLLKNNISTSLLRPNIVDAFLPLAGSIEIRGIIEHGYWDNEHPAAVMMLSVVLLTGLLCKRAFCGWICPIGTVCEKIHAIRLKIIPKAYLPPKWLDWILRTIKYVLLLGILYIVIGMPTKLVMHYLQGNYHKVADIKMAMFFVSPSMITLCVLGLILLVTAWRRQGFCRYICPYGALLGLISFLSPLKIRRDKNHCLLENGLACDKCSRACPADIKVHQCTTVRADECQACLRCVAACPNKKALGLRLKNGKRLCHKELTILLVVLFFVVPLIAYLCGFWESQTPTELKRYLMMNLDRISI